MSYFLFCLWVVLGCLGSMMNRQMFKKFDRKADYKFWCLSPFWYLIYFLAGCVGGIFWFGVSVCAFLTTSWEDLGLSNSWFFRPICKRKH